MSNWLIGLCSGLCVLGIYVGFVIRYEWLNRSRR